MANEILSRDQNHVTVLAGITDNEAQEIKMLRIDPVTKRLLMSATVSGMGITSINGDSTSAQLIVGGVGISVATVAGTTTITNTGGTGTVTSVSVVSANGFAGTVATSTTTPAITLSTTVTGLLKGNGTAISAATPNVDYASVVTITETVYVGKHGNDANNGRSIENAKLTIGAAITTAIALTPSVTNQVAVEIVDAADYTENVTLTTPYLTLYGPTATIIGKITVSDNTIVNIDRVLNSGGDALEKFTSDIGLSVFTANYVIGNISNNANGGQLFLNIQRIDVPANGVGISGDTTSAGHIHCNIRDLYLAGNNAVGIRANVDQKIVGTIDDILEIPLGSFTGTKGISLGDDGDVQVNLDVNRIICDIAYDQDSNNSTLNLFANTITGSRLNTGGGVQNVVVAGEIALLDKVQSFTGKKTFAGVVQTVTSMGAQALDGSLGNVFTRTLAGSETFTQSNFTAGQCFMVEVKQGSGTSYTVTWFSGITWITLGATAPVQTTTTNGTTTYGFRCTGSNTFLGYLISTQ